MPRKKKQFHCKQCRFKTTGPSPLSAHYKKNPTHATQSSKWVAGRRKEKRAQAASEAFNALPLQSITSRPHRKRGLKFCPDCGHDLQGY